MVLLRPRFKTCAFSSFLTFPLDVALQRPHLFDAHLAAFQQLAEGLAEIRLGGFTLIGRHFDGTASARKMSVLVVDEDVRGAGVAWLSDVRRGFLKRRLFCRTCVAETHAGAAVRACRPLLGCSRRRSFPRLSLAHFSSTIRRVSTNVPAWRR